MLDNYLRESLEVSLFLKRLQCAVTIRWPNPRIYHPKVAVAQSVGVVVRNWIHGTRFAVVAVLSNVVVVSIVVIVAMIVVGADARSICGLWQMVATQVTDMKAVYAPLCS